MKTKRQQVVEALDTLLKTILTTNGYETDLGNNVFEWRATPLAEDETPGIIWRDTADTIDLTIGENQHNLNFEILLFAQGTTAPSTIRKMIADVVKAIGSDLTLGGLVEDIKQNSENIGTDQAERFNAVAMLTFTVIYTTEPFNPYQ